MPYATLRYALTDGQDYPPCKRFALYTKSQVNKNDLSVQECGGHRLLPHSPVKVLEELHRHHELVGEKQLRAPPELLPEYLVVLLLRLLRQFDPVHLRPLRRPAAAVTVRVAAR